MIKSLYTRIVLYYCAAVLISVGIGFASAVVLFWNSGYEEEANSLKRSAAVIVQLYEQTRPQNIASFLESAAQLASVRVSLQLTGREDSEQRFNWRENESLGLLCDCEVAYSTIWSINGNDYELKVLPDQEEISGFSEIAFILAIVLLVGGGLMLAAGRHLVKPVKAVTTAAGEIAGGNFGIRLPTDRQDEMGALSASINHMASELGQLDQERQAFVANVSHEFQSPLTSIKGFTQMLLEGALDASEQQRALQIIGQESDRLSKLSDNLLRLAALDSDKLALSPVPFDVAEQIRRTVLAFEPVWSQKGLNVEMSASKAIIQADKELLSQVWSNLMSNAIKFTPPGGAIRIAVRIQEDQLETRFYDSGARIAEKDKPRIFERFYKVDEARDRTREGSGLGLSIVQKIVGIHKGRIRIVDGPLQEGKTFIITLPVPRAEGEVVREHAGNRQQNRPAG
ncbi:sensor histidine kinase [Paenibacillus tarimensis]|uniref:sensor histidine kinase n=1 Tax=Paenibacillus tarimensis TaxID=416012 RepID=UPI001F1A628B|nr:sensor histidine kinase [Paenibacillus tarimensis]MCF2945864.1 ATP-binding protein [Paenibacillus tarimensis]